MGEKTWAFTLNNYTEKEVEILKNLECSVIKFGWEIGEGGTPHLQGAVTFRTSKRLAGLSKILPRAHWGEKIDFESCFNYTLKDGDFFIKDTRRQGKRNDLTDAITTLKKTNKIKDVKKEHPEVYVKYHRGLEKLVEQEDRHFKPEVIWIYGPTGSGKTRQVVEKEKDLWMSGKNLKWWDGYENQEATVFDDFRGDFCTFHELLRILDRYPYTVEVKGGTRTLNSKRMYITSCYAPEEVYSTREDIKQLIRRIDKIIHT